MPGYIKLHRDVQKHWLYEEKRVFSKYEAWLDILMRANHSAGIVTHNGRPERVERGSTIWSLGDMEKRWGWSNTKVKRFLKWLEDDEMLVVKSTTKKTYLTVVNYEKYQGSDNDKTPSKHHQNTSGAPVTHTNKNVKNDNKKPNTYSRQQKTYAEDSSPYRMAIYLHDKIMTFAEGIGKAHLVRDANMQKWADSCRKILELDNRDREEVKAVIDWATSDTFWQQNILSPDKLRLKYKDLCLRMGAQNKKGNGKQNPNDKHSEKNQIEAQKIREAMERERESNPAVILDHNKHLQ